MVNNKVKFILPKSFYDAEWNEHMELVFDNCDLNLEMVIYIREAIAKDTIFTIEDIDNDGDIKLKEIPYTWPPDLFEKVKVEKDSTKQFKVTYSETRTVSVIIEAETGEEAYDHFHNALDDSQWEDHMQYSGEETSVTEVKNEEEKEN